MSPGENQSKTTIYQLTAAEKIAARVGEIDSKVYILNINIVKNINVLDKRKSFIKSWLQ